MFFNDREELNFLKVKENHLTFVYYIFFIVSFLLETITTGSEKCNKEIGKSSKIKAPLKITALLFSNNTEPFCRPQLLTKKIMMVIFIWFGF